MHSRKEIDHCFEHLVTFSISTCAACTIYFTETIESLTNPKKFYNQDDKFVEECYNVEKIEKAGWRRGFGAFRNEKTDHS